MMSFNLKCPECGNVFVDDGTDAEIDCDCGFPVSDMPADMQDLPQWAPDVSSSSVFMHTDDDEATRQSEIIESRGKIYLPDGDEIEGLAMRFRLDSVRRKENEGENSSRTRHARVNDGHFRTCKSTVEFNDVDEL